MINNVITCKLEYGREGEVGEGVTLPMKSLVKRKEQREVKPWSSAYRRLAMRKALGMAGSPWLRSSCLIHRPRKVTVFTEAQRKSKYSYGRNDNGKSLLSRTADCGS